MKAIPELENDNVGNKICKKMITDNADHYCKKFKLYLGNEKYTGNVCKVCKKNEPKDLEELIGYFEGYCMENLK